MSVIVVATFEALPDHRDEVLDLVCRLAPKVHAEPGCQLYAPHTSGKDCVVLVERWADKAALAAHAEGPQMTTFNADVSKLLTGPPRIQVLRPAPAGETEQGALGQP